MKIQDFLRGIAAFRVLSKEDFLSLFQASSEEIFRKGQIIFREGDESDFIWLVKTGWVHLIKRGTSSRPTILFTMSPREILCGVSAFDREPYAADGIAATACALIKISSELFNAFLNHNSAFCREVLIICSSRIRKMAEKLGDMPSPVSIRIAKFLLASISDFGEEVPFTHREISQMMGVRIETSIRMFRLLREKGLVRIGRSCIEILQPALLTQELETWLVGK